MKTIAGIVAMYYRKNKLLPDTTIDCMEYTLTAFENEITKVLLYILVFSVLGLLNNFLLAYIVFVVQRLFAGGIHCKSYWSCAIISFMMLGSCVCGGIVGRNVRSVLCIIAIISVVFPAFLAPMTPSFRMIKRDKHRVLLRILAILISSFWILVAQTIITSNIMSSTVLCTVSLVNYQLIIPPIIKFIKIGGVKE